MKKINRFDLEQEIFNAWHITDDLKTLSINWDKLSEDNKLNIINGMIDLYHAKFDTLFNIFEQCIANREFD